MDININQLMSNIQKGDLCKKGGPSSDAAEQVR